MENVMPSTTNKFALLAAAVMFATAMPLAEAAAASCDNTNSKFAWRRCMSKEIEKLSKAIDQKAFDICSSKTSGSSGPAAVDERLACRLDIMGKTLKSMN